MLKYVPPSTLPSLGSTASGTISSEGAGGMVNANLESSFKVHGK